MKTPNLSLFFISTPLTPSLPSCLPYGCLLNWELFAARTSASICAWGSEVISFGLCVCLYVCLWRVLFEYKAVFTCQLCENVSRTRCCMCGVGLFSHAGPNWGLSVSDMFSHTGNTLPGCSWGVAPWQSVQEAWRALFSALKQWWMSLRADESLTMTDLCWY